MKRRSRRAIPGTMFTAAALALAALPQAARPQVPTPGTPAAQVRQQISAQGLSAALRSRIQSSGLTPDQVRQRLAQAGYDPSTLDPYLAGSESAPEPSSQALAAAQSLGVLEMAPQGQVVSETGERVTGDPARLPAPSEAEQQARLRVFGLDVFARGASEFEPVISGAIPPDYVLGPGDELVLVLTGDVEKIHQLPVTREGFIVIPQVGQVWVNGLTLRQLRDRLYTTLGGAYSGISREGNATTHFEVTLSRLRSNQIFVTGEVQRPGAYLASPLASVLNVLYLAGGPTGNGSFRDIRIVRGGQVARRIDLYDYLLAGDNLSDIILEPGDVIFVPIHGDEVAMRGEVARQAIYELLPGETLADLLDFAGGLATPAAVRRARIERILPPSERTEPGVDRTVVEVNLEGVLQGDVPAPTLEPGDDIRVFRVRGEVRNVVTIAGPVWQNCGTPARLANPDSAADVRARAQSPCSFEWTAGMRLWDLIGRAEGLRPEAYRPRAQIVRVDPSDSTLSIIPVSVETDANGNPVENPALQEYDAVRIFSRTEYDDDMPVRISGEVRNPGAEPYKDSLTLGDLVLRAGGLTPEADLTVEIARRSDGVASGQSRLAEIIHVTLDSTYIVSDRGMRYYLGSAADRPAATDDAGASFRLQPHDHVYVRRIPDLEPERTVAVTGEVRYPGRFALQSKDERLAELIQRSGGLTSTAYAGGFRLYRQGQLVNVDLERALERPASSDNLILLPNDSVFVPEYNPVVVVQGAVNSPAAVLYEEGQGLDHYIANAGGYGRNADRDRVHIRYANGEGAVRRKVVFFRTSPKPRPGSVVTVPEIAPEDRTDVRAVISDIAQIAASLTTVIVVLSRF